MDNVSRVFPVLLHCHASVEAALVALTKRAVKKGLPVLTWSWGKAYSTREHRSESVCLGAGCGGCVKVDRVPLTLVGEAPKYAGWSFLAALEHFDGENIIRAVPECSVPEVYRTRGPVCDHCSAKRRRNETYVLKHEDGRVLQVGSTCLGDFLGTDTAGKLAASASYLAAARGCAEEGCEGLGGSGSGDVTLEEYLVYVAWVVRNEGWMSRTKARETGSGCASADRASILMSDQRARQEAGFDPSAEDVATAAGAAAWGEAITDVDIARETGDYLHNLRVIARSGIVGYKSMGLAASMVVAYQRALGRARKAAERSARPVSEYVGTVKVRQDFGEVTLDFVTGFETGYGYTTLLKFVAPSGAVLVWKSSSTELSRSDVGKKYMLTGTVKKHEEYKGCKQTIVSRCKAVEVQASPSEEASSSEPPMAVAS
jgi:hypothetical protein